LATYQILFANNSQKAIHVQKTKLLLKAVKRVYGDEIEKAKRIQDERAKAKVKELVERAAKTQAVESMHQSEQMSRSEIEIKPADDVR